jgi:hypothetical protein
MKGMLMSNPNSEREQEQALERAQLNAGWESGNNWVADYTDVDNQVYSAWEANNNWEEDEEPTEWYNPEEE